MTHILVIDDRRDDRLLVVRELQRTLSDLTVTEIGAAAELEAALAAGDFDLAITDYQLRWSDGLVVLRALKARCPSSPVIMFSDTATAENAVAAMREGLDDYVSKSPRHYGQLALAVRTALERTAAQQRIAALEAEQADMLAREQAARREAEYAREQLAFLVEAGNVLSNSLDYTTTLQQVAEQAVPRIGDWCAVDILEADGQMTRMAVAHSDPAKIALARELHGRYPPSPAAPRGAWKVIRTGAPELFPTVSDALLVGVARDALHLALLRQLGMRAIILAPLSAREQVLGVLTLVMAESGRSYNQKDLDVAMILARRASLAIQNAQLYTREQRTRLAAERLADRLGRLQAVTAALAAALQPLDVARAVTQQCVQALGARASAVMLLDSSDSALHLLYQTGYDTAFQGWERVPIDGLYPFSDVVRSGASIYLPSRAAFNARYPNLAAAPTITQAVAYLPLLIDSQATGGLSIGFSTPRVLEADERAFLEALASQCAQALERARLYEAELRARERLATLAEASTQLSASLDYDETLQRLALLCVPRLADWCVVDTPAPDGLLDRRIARHAEPDKEQWLQTQLAQHPPAAELSAAVRRVIHTGMSELYPEITNQQVEAATRSHQERGWMQTLGYGSAMIVPLQAHGRVIGALSLMATPRSQRRYTPDDMTLVEELARRAGLALDNARLYAEAQEALRVRDQFLTVASHELKTPLTSLLGHTYLLDRRFAQNHSADARLRRSVQVIASQGQRLNRLVTSLLDLSRLQNNQLHLSLAPLDLRLLVEQVVEEMQIEPERPRIGLVLPDTPVLVQGDALRLEQVLINLIQNAAKYSPEGAPISVSLARHPTSAVLSVRDQGIGIPAAALPHIFTRFYRAPNVDSRHISGMGMGLFLVHEVVTRHGGHVSATSTEGQGTTMTVMLPLAGAGQRANRTQG